jgi:hypothetical protein
LPAKLQNRPEYSQFASPFFFSFDGKSRQRSKRSEGYHFYALGLAVWLAVLLAAFTAILVRAEVLFPSFNVLIIYRLTVAIVNPSYSPVDLSALFFRGCLIKGPLPPPFR